MNQWLITDVNSRITINKKTLIVKIELRSHIFGLRPEDSFATHTESFQSLHILRPSWTERLFWENSLATNERSKRYSHNTCEAIESALFKTHQLLAERKCLRSPFHGSLVRRCKCNCRRTSSLGQIET